MVCTTIRPTKLSYADTNTWQGVAAFVADYFDFEPLNKPMLHVSNNFITNLLGTKLQVTTEVGFNCKLIHAVDNVTINVFR